LTAMMRGHYAYYGITGNFRRLSWYARRVATIWHKPGLYVRPGPLLGWCRYIGDMGRAGVTHLAIGHPLGRISGRSLGRIQSWSYPPGTKSASYRHEGAESFIYLLSGRGTALQAMPFAITKPDQIAFAHRRALIARPWPQRTARCAFSFSMHRACSARPGTTRAKRAPGVQPVSILTVARRRSTHENVSQILGVGS
jgi:hypothetical protein